MENILQSLFAVKIVTREHRKRYNIKQCEKKKVALLYLNRK